MTSARPLVSIVTPSLNQGRYLPDSIQSVANQTYPNIEHCIADAASTDETLDILRTAPAHVRWTSEADGSTAEGTNRAYRASQGEIVGWLGADDALFDVTAVEHVVGMFTRRPDVDVVYGHAAMANAEGLILKWYWVPPFSRWLLRRRSFLITPAVFLRRSVIGEKLVDDSYASSEDRELWLRLAKEGRKFTRLNRVIAVDRKHAEAKFVARRGLAMSEGALIDARYGVTGGLGRKLMSRSLNIVSRIAGAGLTPSAFRPLAFDGHVDGWWPLVRRQLFVRNDAVIGYRAGP